MTELPGINWDQYKSKPKKEPKPLQPHQSHPYIEWTPARYPDYAYHVSPRHNRESIEARGLKPHGSDVPDMQHGLYVAYDSPEIDYGDDVYAINPGNRKVGTNDLGHSYLTRPVKTSDFKRVGHVFHNPQGHTEVHWHREEDCPSASR